MGRIILQMMVSVDGLVSGPHGELDWIANDEALSRAHLTTLKHADLAILGAGSYPEMSSYWMAVENDEKAKALIRDIGRAINKIPKIVYRHTDMPVKWHNAKVHVVADENALVQDVQHLKQATQGTILVYGGVRLARTFVQRDLLDEIQLDVCPLILGLGQPLFTDLTHRTKLRLCKTVPYDSGAATLYYEVAKIGSAARTSGHRVF